MIKGPPCFFIQGLNLLYTDKGSVLSSFFERNYAIVKRKKSEVFSHSYVFSWVKLGSSLSYNDVTSDGFLSSKKLHAQSFAHAVSPVV
jgi:hypothetical protein